jgi:hypothetical protein
MRTMRIKDYTFEQLAEKSLIPLLEFYPMKYLTTLGSKKERDTFLSDIKKVPEILENLLEADASTKIKEMIFSRASKISLFKQFIAPQSEL